MSSPQRPNADRYRLALLIVVLAAVAASSVGITIRALYVAALDETRTRLLGTVQSQARLLEAIARFDAEPGRWRNAVAAFTASISRFEDAQKHFRGFGETGEFTLARKEGDRIVFLLSSRARGTAGPAPIPFASDLAEPMRRALRGESGAAVARDYRGREVVAAFEPVAILDLGMVAKIDLEEIRGPFVRAGLLAGAGAIVLVLLGAVAFLRITSPLIRRLEERVAERTRDLEAEVAERRAAEERLLVYQEKLRSLASELILTEEHERRRIATELHDHVGQILAVIQMRGEALRAASDPAEKARRFEEISRLVDEMSDGVRSLTFVLSPPVLYELGLTAGLEWLGEQFGKEHGLDVEVVDSGGAGEVDEDMRVLVFRVVREALMNVVKHARAGSAGVSLWREGAALHVEVEDDGVGFEPAREGAAKGPSGGFGLFSIRERMESVGGSLEIDTGPGRGTRLHLTVPLGRPAPGQP